MICIKDYYFTDSNGYTERYPRYCKDKSYLVTCSWVGDLVEQNIFTLSGGLNLTNDELYRYFQDISVYRDEILTKLLEKRPE
jgi:hypothetical protein